MSDKELISKLDELIAVTRITHSIWLDAEGVGARISRTHLGWGFVLLACAFGLWVLNAFLGRFALAHPRIPITQILLLASIVAGVLAFFVGGSQ